MNTTMHINTAGFNAQLEQLRQANGRAAGSMVRYWSRITLKKLAWKTNKASRKWRKSGRLRAGWWPAAQALGMSGVYSGTYGNHGEGHILDNSHDPIRPSITMTNTVPYSSAVKDIIPALEAGMQEVEARARNEMHSVWKRELVAMGGGFAL